jgi:hypothetical protein
MRSTAEMAIAASLVGYVVEVEAVVLGIHRIFVQLQTCATKTTPTPKRIVGVSTRFVCGPDDIDSLNDSQD